MDPDENLREQRELADDLVEAEGTYDQAREADVQRLAELVLALDEWLGKGGFLPKRWQQGREIAGKWAFSCAGK